MDNHANPELTERSTWKLRLLVCLPLATMCSWKCYTRVLKMAATSVTTSSRDFAGFVEH